MHSSFRNIRAITRNLMTLAPNTSSANVLYYNPGSVFSNIGVLLLSYKGILDQVELKPVKMGVDNIAPWYIRLNPKGQVPTLVHEGKAIPDTLAIARYLDSQIKPSIFSADDAQVVDTVERWREVRVLSLLSGKKTDTQDVSQMEATLQTSRQQVAKYASEHPDLAEAYKVRLDVHDDRAKILVDHKTHELHKQKLRTLLDDTEKALTDNNGRLLSGHDHTVADIYATGILYWLKTKLDKDILGSRPIIEKYYQEQTSSPSFTNALK